jgi:spore germination protein GerM
MRRVTIRVMCALAVLAAGCAVPAQQDAQSARDEAVPFALLDPQAPPIVPPEPGPSSEPVALCFVRDGRLVIVTDEVAAPADLRAALDALASPPPDAGPLLRTALTDPSVVRDVRLLGGIARVDLQPDVSALPADEQLLAVAQIVCTLTGRPGVGQVSFTLQGARLAVPKGDGSLVSSPVARDDYAGLMR